MAPQMTPQVLADYIKSQLQRGIAEAQIKDYLLTEKITQSEIDEALKIVKGPSISQPQPAPLQKAAPAQPSSQFGVFQQPSIAKPAMPQQPIAPKPGIMQTSDISKPNFPQQPPIKPAMPQQPAFSGSNTAQPQILNTGMAAKPANQTGPSIGMGNTLGTINISSNDNIAPKKSNKLLYIILAVVLVLVIGGGAFAYFKFANTPAPVAEIPATPNIPAVAPTSTQEIATSTQINPNVITLDQETLRVILSISPDQSVITFATSTSLLNTLVSGNIIVFPATKQTPGGLARQIISVTSLKGKIIITTAQAPLSEIMPNGSINTGSASSTGVTATPTPKAATTSTSTLP